MSSSENRRTETTVSFRVAPDEARIIEEKGRSHGLSAGQYAKTLALSDIQAPVPIVRPGPPRDAHLLRAIVAQMGKLGSNLNQIARAANTPGMGLDPVALRIAFRDLTKMRTALMTVLGVRDP